ncbi:type I DNA topoisomerase [Megalodesulfovibrio paquesii]
MAKDLIIVESPAKVKTIKKFLGSNYEVEASVGHVRDLPSRRLGVDEGKDFLPEYEVIEGKEKVVAKLKSQAAKSRQVYLAPDPDREGEAIAYHVAELIKGKNTNIQRIQFNEITPRAVKEALEHPREINTKLFESQQARRILDRLVGYKISPLLWNKVKRGISAGRVQSVALRLVVDREKERRAFVPEEYWVFKALLATGQTPDAPQFIAELTKIGGKKAKIGSKDEAKALEKTVKAASFVVSDVTEKERSRTPPPPFITSTLQQAANQRLGYPAKKTMGTAQRLYEGVDLGERGTMALITYMRTDSVRISDDARTAAREFITAAYGQDYYPPQPRYFKTKGSAQDAHEAIRPVDVSIRPDSLKGELPSDQYHLYKLIWERFVASQMAAARFWDTTVLTTAANTEWKAKGERLLFPGFLAVTREADAASQELPKLESGQALALVKLNGEQKFTQPPPRFSEASLVRELEEKGIGRPSTYAAIISTLLDRDYCRLDKKLFAPTDLGETVSDLLAEHFKELMDVDFTAGMEERLDQVADGDANWVDLLRQFTGGFYATLKDAEKQMQSVKAGLETGLTCELCGKPMVVKFGKAGPFLACTGYPDCSNTKNFTRDENGQITVVEAAPVQLQKVGTCPDCGHDLVLKKSRTGSRFIACSNYPKCKHAEPFSTGVRCPREGCTGELVEKSSKRGKVFYSCNTFPKCDFALWDWPIPEPCPLCDSPVLVRKTTKAKGEHIACPNKGCRYTREIGGSGEGGEEG